MLPAEDKPLTAMQQLYCDHRRKGMSSAAAARAAGYSSSYSAKAAQFLDTQARIKAVIEREQQALREAVKFSVEDAVADAARKAALWEKTNPMASFKATELVSRLLGYLVEKLHMKVETIDIRDVLIEARRRAIGSAETVEYEMLENVEQVNPFS